MTGVVATSPYSGTATVDFVSLMTNLNTTDYEFPEMWGRFSDEQKSRWYTRQRVNNRARRQWEAMGRPDHTTDERLGTDTFRKK